LGWGTAEVLKGLEPSVGVSLRVGVLECGLELVTPNFGGEKHFATMSREI
jgi:hypothetical protein